MKSILVTGAGGFIGSHLVEQLIENGFKVKALIEYNSFNHHGWLEKSKYKNDCEIIFGDIRDKYFCTNLTKNVEKIFNLAALISIPYSYVSPNSYFQTNAIGVLNLCEASLENNVDELIQMSTSEVYGSAQYLPIDENHPTVTQSPYSASKLSAEAIANSFNLSFGLNIKIARVFNTFGPRQSTRAIIPVIISQLLSKSDKIKVGSLDPTRDLNYVSDSCSALIALANAKINKEKIFNIGSNKSISIKNLAEKIMELTNIKKEIISDKKRIRPINSEVNNLQCDNNLFQSLTNFTPQVSLSDGLLKTINWFSSKIKYDNFDTNYNI